MTNNGDAMAPPAPRMGGGGARRSAALALVILGLTLLAYAPALRGDFLWDDNDHFSENVDMTRPGGLAALWRERAMYYPLTSTTFWVARRAWGLNPLTYHLLNVLLHGCNAILLWHLLRRLRVPGAWLAGAIFALHPVNVQSVAWMTELKNCQSGLFYLLALHAWLSNRERGGWPAYGGALLFFLLALLSKTSTVVLPLILLVIHLWWRDPLDRRALAAWAPFCALSALAALVTVGLHRHMVAGPEWSETLPQRVILAAHAVWFYLSKFFVPLRLTFVYPRWEVSASRLAEWLWLPGVALLAGAPLVCRRRAWSRPTALALAGYVLCLAPVLNFCRMYYTRYSYVADHWQYLAAMSAVAWVGGGTTWLMARAGARRRAAAILLPTALLAVLGFLTWRQAHIYRNSVTLWTDTIKKNPDGAIAYHNLGCTFLRLGQGQIAERVLATGLESNPDDVEMLTAYGAALLVQAHPQEALAPLEKALRLAPRDPDALNDMGMALARLGRGAEATQMFRRALEQKPEMIDACVNLALALADGGHPAEAREVVARGLRYAPAEPRLLQLREGVRSR